MWDADTDGTNDNIGELNISITKKIAIRPSLDSFRVFLDRDIMTSPNFISLLCLMGSCFSNPFGVDGFNQVNYFASSQLGFGAY